MNKNLTVEVSWLDVGNNVRPLALWLKLLALVYHKVDKILALFPTLVIKA